MYVASPPFRCNRTVPGKSRSASRRANVNVDEAALPLANRATRGRWRKSSGMTAGEVMTTPAAAIKATVGVRTAARTFTVAGVNRLCVVDAGGRLIGLLSRCDLLAVFLRPDNILETEIRRTFPGRVHSWQRINVRVKRHVVYLSGNIAFHGAAQQAEHLAPL